MWFRWLPLLMVLSGFPPARAQQSGLIPGIPKQEEKVGTPAEKPERRHRVWAEPVVILRNLIDTSPAKRELGLRQLGRDVASSEVSDVRLAAVQLDEDDALEVVLVFELNAESNAVVLDRGAQGWWSVGEFQDYYRWVSSRTDQLIQLRGIVSSSRKDIIVRVVGGGSSLETTELAMYRMLQGRLYRVFQTIERTIYSTAGPGYASGRHSEQRQFFFPERPPGQEPLMVLHHTKTACGTGRETRRTGSSCSVYVWRSARFAFERDPQSEPNYCDATTRSPRVELASGCSR